MLTETEFYQHIGHNIRLYRKQAGLRQDELAEHVGLVRTSVSNIESGLQHAPAYTLYQVAEVLGCSLGDLLVSGEETPISEAGAALLQQVENTALNVRERMLLMEQLTNGR